MANSLIKSAKDILALAAHISVFNLTTVFITLANGLMLAKLGTNSLAAGAIIGITQLSLMMIFTSPLFAISSIISRLSGEGKNFQIGGVIQHGLLLSLLLSIPAITGMIFIKPILNAFGQPLNLIELVKLYFDAYVWGTPAAMLLTCSQQFMLGLKKTRLITIIGVISLIISVFLSYILTFGKLGLTPLGVSGLGYAQAARTILMLIILFGFIFLNNDFENFRLLSKRPLNKFSELRQLIKLGWPISVHAASEYLVMFSITLIAGSIGQTALVAQQISTQYIQALSIFYLAFSQASNLLVSTSIGKQDWKSMSSYGLIAVMLGFGIGLLATLGFALFSNFLISPYINVHKNFEFAQILRQFLMITMIGQLLGAGKAISIGLLRALYDTKLPMIIGAICGWGITIPFALIATNIWDWGVNGLAVAQIIGVGSCMLLLLDRWRVLSFNIGSPNKQINTISYRLWKHSTFKFINAYLKVRNV